MDINFSNRRNKIAFVVAVGLITIINLTLFVSNLHQTLNPKLLSPNTSTTVPPPEEKASLDAYGSPCPVHPFQICQVGFAENCTKDDQCIQNLYCRGETKTSQFKKCACDHPEHQRYFHVPNFQCERLVGSTCDPDDNEFPCVSNSECLSISGSHLCECKEGFIENEKRECDIAHQYDCTDNKLSTNKVHVSCDTIADLVCSEGSCECRHKEKVYEEEQRKCSTPLGLACFHDWECVYLAECKKITVNSTSGRCTCTKLGYYADLTNPKTCIN